MKFFFVLLILTIALINADVHTSQGSFGTGVPRKNFDEALDKCKSMSIHQIKQELDQRHVDYHDIREKPEFIERLASEMIGDKNVPHVGVSGQKTNARSESPPLRNSKDKPTGSNQKSLPDVDSMSVCSIRKELQSLGVSTQGLTGREDFVNLLQKVRKDNKA